MTDIPLRQIRAVYDDDTIRVYQAYGSAIADSLHANGRFVDPPFKLTRMTWIKPSFLWMMYRCGWSYKDDGQRRVFAFDISRDGFEWALAHSCSSHPEGLTKAEVRTLMDANPVRVQWDPERDVRGQVRWTSKSGVNSAVETIGQHRAATIPSRNTRYY